MPGLSAPPRGSLEHQLIQPTWKCLGRAQDLVGEGPFALSADGLDLVVVRTEGGLRAYQGRCPHQGALLGEGEMDGNVLVCRNHRWRFDSVTGERQGAPGCLVSCPAEMRGAELWVDVSPLLRAATLGIAGRRTLDDLPGHEEMRAAGLLDPRAQPPIFRPEEPDLPLDTAEDEADEPLAAEEQGR